MENHRSPELDNQLIEITYYQANKEHDLKNMTFLRPGFCQVLRGTKIMQFADNECISSSGSLSYIAPHTPILMQHITNNGSFESIIVTFPVQILSDFNARYQELLHNAQDIKIPSQLVSIPDQQDAWQKVIRALNQKEHPKVVKYYFEGWLLRLAIAGKHISVSDNNKTFAQRVTERISQNWAGSPRLADISKSLFISESTLLRRLKEEGVHYRQLKEEVYLSLAMDQVQAGKMPIKQIAFLAGYSSTSRFIARFKNRFGLTPGALRKVLLLG